MPEHMTPIDLWLSHGQRVRIKTNKPYLKDRIGTVDQFYYVTGEYLIRMEDGKTNLPIPFTPSEIEKIA